MMGEFTSVGEFGVLIAEITALLTTLRFVGSGQLGEFLILTDSLSSIEALRKISENFTKDSFCRLRV
jgi:hypothetical protein